MKKWSVLLLSFTLLLTGCGQTYDKEIKEVIKLEKKIFDDMGEAKDSNDKSATRDDSNINVYEDGNVITITNKPFKDFDSEVTSLYKRNETTGKYEREFNKYYESDESEKYMKEHKPDYQEENMK
ncbi:cystatin-like fold lipoprotein [Mammaliicoccus sp. J-M41]|uniref:cystatin-like fold lipoprotein n=1 Tax=Mammaliicoccus sp. J-M41 TaxID=2898700 RepID=UPI001EFBCDD0|nr:cystatin-like fold lipoprotein [Mammaliicoccus sp. J-M41]